MYNIAGSAKESRGIDRILAGVTVKLLVLTGVSVLMVLLTMSKDTYYQSILTIKKAD